MTQISLLGAYLNKSIPQNLLLTERDLERYARERGLDIRQEDLEFFEELGLLYPLGRVKLPVVEEHNGEGKTRKRYAALYDISHNLSRWYEEGLCEDPTKTKFRPWKEYKDGLHETARALYHPLQFLNLRRIAHWLGYRISVPQILDEERFKRISGNVKGYWGSQKNWKNFIAKRVLGDLKFFPFMLLIEDIYLPIVRSHFKGVPGQPDFGFQTWQSLRSKFQQREVLSESNLTMKEIQNWRRQIAAQASFLDPLRDWYLLVRHCIYYKRQKLAGDALFAQDCYEIVEILGLFLKELTGEPQYGSDDLLDGRHGAWKKDRYRAEVDFANKDVLRKIAYEYGLDYDYKLLLFVEGDTEFHFLPIIADAIGISFARLGIRLEKLGGSSEIAPKRIEKLLQYAKRDEMAAYIIIDNHQHTKDYVEELIVREDLPVTRDRVRVWDVDFEEDNFSIDELVEATRRVAAKNEVSVDIAAESIEERRKHKEGIGNILIDLSEQQMFRLSKADLGKELGLMVAERIKKGELNTTEIEKELLKVAGTV